MLTCESVIELAIWSPWRTTGSLAEPMAIHDESGRTVQWLWLRENPELPNQDGMRCVVTADQFWAMTENLETDGHDEYLPGRAVAYSTKNQALAAADRAGVLIADHQYEREFGGER